MTPLRIFILFCSSDTNFENIQITFFVLKTASANKTFPDFVYIKDSLGMLSYVLSDSPVWRPNCEACSATSTLLESLN